MDHRRGGDLAGASRALHKVTGYIILGILLALSAAGNAWQFHHGEVILEAKAATAQLATDTKAAAEACSTGVTDLQKAGAARQKELVTALKGAQPKVAALEAAATVAARAKPDNAQDLCGSLERYLKAQVKADRGGK